MYCHSTWDTNQAILSNPVFSVEHINNLHAMITVRNTVRNTVNKHRSFPVIGVIKYTYNTV